MADLILDDDLGAQSVVRVPLLDEGETMLRPFVLSLQRPSHFTGLTVGRACAGELLQITERYCQRRCKQDYL